MANRSSPCARPSISAMACSAITGASRPRMLVITRFCVFDAGVERGQPAQLLRIVDDAGIADFRIATHDDIGIGGCRGRTCDIRGQYDCRTCGKSPDFLNPLPGLAPG